jgi:AcrR family transcriptional regulator
MEVTDKYPHEEQRNRVIEMAGKMFAEQGIRKVRMDDVA